jgi:hypothetical protein
LSSQSFTMGAQCLCWEPSGGFEVWLPLSFPPWLPFPLPLSCESPGAAAVGSVVVGGCVDVWG